MVARVLPAACSLTMLLTPGALAQDDGVTIDPDSPTAKEYAIPLESARRDAAPGRETSEPPLFGEGVTPESDGDAQPASGGPGSSREPGKPRRASRDSGDDASNGDALTPSALKAVAEAAERPGAPGGGGSTLLVIGAGIALVAAAAGAGLIARRRSA